MLLSAGLIDARTAINSITVDTPSKRACKTVAERWLNCLTVKPIETSTITTLKIAIAEICSVLSLYFASELGFFEFASVLIPH